MIIYTISGFCAGLAAYLTLSRFASTTIAGHSLDNLKAITAVVLGGAPACLEEPERSWVLLRGLQTNPRFYVGSIRRQLIWDGISTRS